jgi:uracil-xanthine permease
MFGASVLVPVLFKIDPAIVLFFNGIGTLLYAFLTKRKIPAFLGSSFAFLSPAFFLMEQGYDFSYVQGGFVVSGLIFALVGIIVKYTGIQWINKVFPPASMGAIVTIIGLELAPTAADMAGFPVGGANTQVFNPTWVTVSMITLLTVVFCSVLCRGFLKVIPILIGVVVGYITSWAMGLINFDGVAKASMIVIPNMQLAKFDINAIIIILPATFVVVAEHIGHLTVTSSIMGRNLAKDPGLHRSLLGDGLSTALSGMFGSVPTTTYGENIGVMAITKVYSTYVVMGAGALSILLAFSGKLSSIINSIPIPVIGGISLLLFGTIATSGLRTFIQEKVDFSRSRNLILTSVILIIGLSGIRIQIGVVELKGMALATMIGIVLNLVFIILDKFNLMMRIVKSLILKFYITKYLHKSRFLRV